MKIDMVLAGMRVLRIIISNLGTPYGWGFSTGAGGSFDIEAQPDS